MTYSTAKLLSESESISAEAGVLCSGLSPEQLATRSVPGRWSIAEHLRHLVLSTEIYLPTLASVFAETRTRPHHASAPFTLSFKGRVLVWLLQPPVRFRLPTQASLAVSLDKDPERALQDFLRSESKLQTCLQQATGLDFTQVYAPSPLDRRLKLNALEMFALLNAHARRHLWLAAIARRAL